MKTDDPRDRMGVYEHFEEVPDRYRLGIYSGDYSGRDTWAEFAEWGFARFGSSDHWRELTDRAGRRWKAHMEEQSRHHALATPKQVEEWFNSILEGASVATVYNVYYTRLERFYSYLQNHADHPHVYHPVWMAAVEFDATRAVWDYKQNKGKKEVNQ